MEPELEPTPRIPTAPPTPPAFADGVARPLEPGWIAASRFGGLMTFAILGLIAACAWLAVLATGKIPFRAMAGVGAGIALLVVVALALAALWPTWEYRRAGYRVLPDRIESWSGLVWRRSVSVPISRVQYTDVKQGPVQRSNGIATLVVHTAGTVGSDVEFPGLPPALASEIRDWLVAQTGSDAV